MKINAGKNYKDEKSCTSSVISGKLITCRHLVHFQSNVFTVVENHCGLVLLLHSPPKRDLANFRYESLIACISMAAYCIRIHS